MTFIWHSRTFFPFLIEVGPENSATCTCINLCNMKRKKLILSKIYNENMLALYFTKLYYVLYVLDKSSWLHVDLYPSVWVDQRNHKDG